MSGHSHWAKVKRAKAVTDNKRGSVWSKLARRIIVAAKTVGGDPGENLMLRYAIDEAKAENMPRDTIQNAIKKGTGELGAAVYERIMYEAYGPGGVALMIDCLTDNRSRTAPELRNTLERVNGELAQTNSVGWMFQQKGTFVIAASLVAEDKLIEICLDAGADDVKTEGDVYEVTCEPTKYNLVKEALAKNQIETVSAQVAFMPKTTVTPPVEKARQVLTLMETLEDNEDVQNVYTNMDIPEELVAKLAGKP